MGRQPVKPQESLKHLSDEIGEAAICDQPGTGMGEV